MTSSPRLAVVGCGHGSLNEIYGQIETLCAARGWDGVDAVIVGGDFQSLRNANDAACISVPAKYRKIGDFHEYYSGARVAPYLTIFCGGNHEASNYLFELFYGGWVAPNIYFMGAANVLRLGSLRIAGMSGIWKGYDYRKAHSERLPYTYDDLSSIYHIREVDVRKLLHLRSQVDVGLSHDWPRGIEAFGDIAELFRKKGHLRDDSTHGRLGSQAAREVLDYLRPGYWFSAHLHVKYLATMAHDGAKLRKLPPNDKEPHEWAFEASPKSPVKATFDISTRQQNSDLQNPPTNKIGLASGTDEERMAAWRSFGVRARENERSAAAKFRAEYEAKEDTEITMPAHKLISKDLNGNVRDVSWVAGKKAKLDNNPVQNDDEIDLGSSNSSSGGSNRSSPSHGSPAGKISPVKAVSQGISDPQNPPTNKIGLATGSDVERMASWTSFGARARQNERAAAAEFRAEYEARKGTVVTMPAHKLISKDLNGNVRDVSWVGGGKTKLDNNPVQNDDEIDLASSNGSSHGSPPGKANPDKAGSAPSIKTDGASEARSPQSLVDRAVSQNLRTKLPGSFAAPPVSPTGNRAGPKAVPEAVTNLMTKFMALDKPGNRDSCIELVELTPVAGAVDPNANTDRPFRLQYDKEWLAITRAFADDLQLGPPSAPVPTRTDDAKSLAAIKDAENWVEQNVVQKGLLDVPLNFVAIAPFYDPSVPITTPDMPMEYPNNQTEDFCKLIGIKNKFALADEERAARMEAGAARRAGSSPAGGSARRNPTRGKRAGRGRGGRGPGKSGKGKGADGNAMDVSW